MRFRFPSLDAPNIRYVIYKNWSDNPTNGKGISDRVTAFDTYGDGEVQHSPEWPVQNDVTTFTDFLESLATALVARDEEDWAECLSFWPESRRTERDMQALFAFASQPLFKEDNKQYQRYYSLDECKVSTSDSKRHDRRWQKVESNMNGTLEAFMWITKDVRPSGLIGMYWWLGQAFDRVEGYSRYDAQKWLKMDHSTWDRVWSAFECCNEHITAVLRVHQIRQWTKSRVENIQRRRATATETPAEAVPA